MKRINSITVLYNLPELSDESDTDTQKSAQRVAEELKRYYDVRILGIDSNDIGNLMNLKTDFVFNLVEWSGLNSQWGVKVIETLEKAGLPYSGSNSWGYWLSCNKKIMKEEMDKKNIPTPRWFVNEGKLKFPVIVKPVLEHCGIGISQTSVCYNDQDTRNKGQEMMEKYKQPVLVEEYIDGRELHVTILEKNGEPWVLPPAEVIYEKKEGHVPILSYEMKWNEKSEEYKMARMQVAKLDKRLEKEVGRIAKKCYLELGGRDYPRLDLRIRDNEIFVLEINNNPGIDYDVESGIGVSARAVSLNWEDLLKHIVENAWRRFV